MRNSIANYKESLSRIASDVLDAAAEEELDAAGSRSGQASPPSARRSSRRASLPASPRLPNGASPDRATEMEQYKAEIERLQISEAQIKSLAINYAAILKEKEAHLSRLHEENNVLRKSLDAKSGPIGQVSDENSKPTKNSSIPHKANQSPSKQQKITTVVSPLSPGSSSQRNAMVKADTFSNGGTYTVTNTRATQTQKDLETLLEENNRNWTGIHAKHESEIKELMFELKNEREISVDYKLKYSDEQRRSISFQKDIHDLKLENERTSAEIKDLQNKLAGKMSEIGQMQAEISRLNTEKVSDETLQNLQTSIALLQEENKKLKLEKERLTAASELAMENNVEAINNDNLESLRKLQMSNKETEDMRMTIQELEKTLKETCSERDKAQKELARLKQHLLDKDLEESEKMDEDNKIIDELRAISEHQKVHIMKLEKALRQEIAKYEEARNTKADEIRKLNETIDDLNKKLLNYMIVVDSKNGELLNLQTALGQYYAESEAKERLERDLAAAKEESVKLSDSLKVALQDCQLVSKEKEDMFSKVSQAEKMLSESKRTIQKLQEDNSKLHRAVEQSVTRINRMSMDSDFSVDRRIVIKLLVTYFQRNHSKEVLDLMVRMLGFSDEDKQRIGFAQQNAGKSAVRGVLGLPGRLVGGMLGGKTSISSEASSENQSFADLWVDFLLKETEQRERRESGPVDQSSSIQDKAFSATAMPTGSGTPDKYNASTQHPTSSQLSSPSERPSRLSASDMEFATVPLTSSAFSSSETNTRFSRFLQR